MPINQPGQADVHVNRPLTLVSLAFLQDAEGFVADRVFPIVSVPSKSDLYYTYDRGDFNRDEMEKRAAGTESAGATYTLSTDSYLCDVWALHKDVADQVRANADDQVRLDEEAALLLSGKALIRREKAWADEHFVTGIWTNEDNGVTSGPVAGTSYLQWDLAASTPIEDVRSGKRLVQASTGFIPNKFVCNKDVYDALIDHPDIVARLDRGQTPNGPAMANREALAALFEVDEILVMEKIINTAVEGATNAHSFIGGKHALLVYAAPAPGLMTPSGGYTFVWSGLLGGGVMGSRISRMRMEHLKSDRFEIEQAWDQKLVAADLGMFFLDAVA